MGFPDVILVSVPGEGRDEVEVVTLGTNSRFDDDIVELRDGFNEQDGTEDEIGERFRKLREIVQSKRIDEDAAIERQFQASKSTANDISTLEDTSKSIHKTTQLQRVYHPVHDNSQGDFGARLRRLRELLISKETLEQTTPTTNTIVPYDQQSMIDKSCLRPRKLLDGHDCDDNDATKRPEETDTKLCYDEQPTGLSMSRSDPPVLICNAELENLQREVEQLRAELRGYKYKLDEDSEPYQTELQSKRNQIEIYELKLASRDRTSRMLSDDLAEATRRIAELEVHLEVHDFKFISYEQYKKVLDKQALQKLNEDILGRSSSDDSESSLEAYVEKLISDQEELEMKYAAAKADSVERITKLQRECSEYREKLASLQHSCSARGTCTNEQNKNPEKLATHEDASSDTSPQVSFFRQKIQLLETKNIENRCLITTLRSQVEELTSLLQRNELKYEHEFGILHRENLALENKVTALELERKSLLGEMGPCEKSRHYEMLESTLDDYLAEVSRLEERLRTKDRIISRLRSKVVEYRLADASLEDALTP